MGRDGLSRLFPESWFDAEFVNALYQATQVVTKHLAKCFVDLRRAGFAPETVAELRLNHEEDCLDV
jgi:hypothetical protein